MPAFFVPIFMSTTIQQTITERLATAEPEVEVLLAEVGGKGTLRVIIDHPEGVTLDLCERVTREFDDLRERYALEVSSPGAERPLVTVQHFQKFIGRRAKVRLKTMLQTDENERPQRSFTGEIVGADEVGVTLGTDAGVVSLPLHEIQRSNLVQE